VAKQQQGVFRRVVVPIGSVIVFIAGLIIFVDEYSAATGEFRLTIWDKLQGRTAVPIGRGEVSQQLAIEICKQQARVDFGRDLLQVDFDQRSSRYNMEIKVHTIFADLVIKDSERDPIYIRCDISAVNREILQYRVKGMKGFYFFQ
jgi:hypothetical protein